MRSSLADAAVLIAILDLTHHPVLFRQGTGSTPVRLLRLAALTVHKLPLSVP